jgi:hypothetical protein
LITVVIQLVSNMPIIKGVRLVELAEEHTRQKGLRDRSILLNACELGR